MRTNNSSRYPVPAAAVVADERAFSGKEEVQEQFKEAFRGHPAGVAIITADSPEGPIGLTATSVCSVSLNPPALAFSLSALSSTAPALRAAKTVLVHMLDSRAVQVAQRFATTGIDRFAGTAWEPLPTGEPLLLEAVSWFRGSIIDTVELNGSAVAVMEIIQAGGRSDGESAGPGDSDSDDAETGLPESDAPLVYYNRSWHRLSPDSEITL